MVRVGSETCRGTFRTPGKINFCISYTSRNSYLPLRMLCKNSRMRRKDPAAVQLGRKGGKRRAQKLTAEERQESARKAARARWAHHKKSKSDKLLGGAIS
jgi:hypothetical protein